MPSPITFARILEFFSEFEVVVNFSIENNYKALGFGMHRLTTSGRKIENGQTPMGQNEGLLLVMPNPIIIRPAMGYGICHLFRTLTSNGRVRIVCFPKTYDSTHNSSKWQEKINFHHFVVSGSQTHIRICFAGFPSSEKSN